MPKFVTAREAVEVIRDGDQVWTNAFLALVNPAELCGAIADRFTDTGHPRDLTLYCSAGFGDWTEGSQCEEFVRLGAVKSVVLGHFGSTPETARMVLRGDLEGYNLPLGVMSHMLRSAASGKEYYITDIGVNLFVDPIYKGYRMNAKATQELVDAIEIDGKRMLKYKTPQLDIALIKGTSADSAGNISFEEEATVCDALSLAQAVHRRGGKVIVQVRQQIEGHHRPWDVIVPGALVDYIVVCPQQKQLAGIDGYSEAYAGDVFLSPEEIAQHVNTGAGDLSRVLVARRAVKELKAGDMVNIGVGIPESVAAQAAQQGLLQDVVLTVEAGAMNGLPAPGKAFGASIGAHSVCTMAQQFDFYDGGGLDICYIGGLEIDKEGNVNGHYSSKKLSGIGGFANITQSTKKVVFCVTFTAGGLQVEEQNGQIRVLQEGRFPKFVDKVQAVSFSAKNAKANGQEVLYVTERCVFRLGEDGLELAEVMPGIDLQRDILAYLPFEVALAENLK